MVEKAHPPTGIPANATTKSAPATHGGSVLVQNIVEQSSSNRGNTPGTHCRGDECCQGDPIRSVLPQKGALVLNYIDHAGPLPTNWNTPEADHCGDQTFQGNHASSAMKRNRQESLNSYNFVAKKKRPLVRTFVRRPYKSFHCVWT